jgi:hypothetical protein
MKVLVCGSRDWNNKAAISSEISRFKADTIIIQGGARGADSIAKECAEYYGLHCAEILPLWDHFGKRAGHIRNEAMLELEPDLVLAFSSGSAGTQSTIDKARKKGIPVEVYGTERSCPSC